MSAIGKVVQGETPLMSVYPGIVDDSDSGANIDCNGLSTTLLATQIVGAVSGTLPTLDGKWQESTDGVSFTDVASGAHTQVTASNQKEILVIDRTKRYLRHNRTAGGTGPEFVLTAFVIPVDATECVYTKGDRCIYGSTRRLTA